MIPPPSVAKTKSNQSMAAILAILSLLLAASPYASADSAQGFFQCFTEQSKNPSIILSPNTPSYISLFNSTVRNSRLLTSTWPSFILTPEKPSDVQAAVTCGKTHNFHLRVRSGGHDYEGQSYVSSGDPFVLLDLSGATSVIVSRDNVTAWIGAGATIGEVYYHVNVDGSENQTTAFPSAICTTVGVGGVFSAGGIGKLVRKFGTSADNIIDALVVNSNGDMLDRKTMGEDLFWAIRGGGGSQLRCGPRFQGQLSPGPSHGHRVYC